MANDRWEFLRKYGITRVCLNGHLQTEDSESATELCPKCRAVVWSECPCGYPLLSARMSKDYRPKDRQKALPCRDYCLGCNNLYPWVRAWLLRPVVGQEFTSYELDVARQYVESMHLSVPVPREYGLTLSDVSQPLPRSWLNKIFGGGIRIESPDHPKHSQWAAYQKAYSEYPAAEVERLRMAAYDARTKELQKESRWRELSGQEFEREFSELLRRQKYKVKHTGGPGDQGADIILEATTGRIVVQCKAYTGKVGPQPVRDLCGSMVHHRAAEGWLVAIDGFTESAYEFAHDKPIKLLMIRSFLGKQRG